MIDDMIRFNRDMVEKSTKLLDSLSDAGNDTGVEFDVAVQLNKDAKTALHNALWLADFQS